MGAELRVALGEGVDFIVISLSPLLTKQLHESLTRLFSSRRQAAPFNELSRCVKCGNTKFLTKIHARRCTFCSDGVVEITWLQFSAQKEMLRLLHSGGALHVAMSLDSGPQRILGFIQTVPCAMLGLNALIGGEVVGGVMRSLGRRERYVYVATSAVSEGSKGLGVEQVLLEHALKHWNDGRGVPLLVRVEGDSEEESWYEGFGLRICARLPQRGGFIMSGNAQAH